MYSLYVYIVYKSGCKDTLFLFTIAMRHTPYTKLPAFPKTFNSPQTFVLQRVAKKLHCKA